MLRKMKDAALTKGIKVLLNTQLKSYGKLSGFRLDLKEKRIAVEIMLEGEKEPLSVEAARYELSQQEGRYRVAFYGIVTSRVWLNRVAEKYVEGRAFEIPSEYAKVLKTLF